MVWNRKISVRKSTCGSQGGCSGYFFRGCCSVPDAAAAGVAAVVPAAVVVMGRSVIATKAANKRTLDRARKKVVHGRLRIASLLFGFEDG